MQKTQVLSLGGEDPLEKEMATHSSTFAWEVPWTEEPGGLQSTGSQRVRHDLATKLQKLLQSVVCQFQLWASLVAQTVKNPPGLWETWVQSLGWEDLLEEGMATLSSILAWRIPMDRGAWQTIVHEVAKSQT